MDSVSFKATMVTVSEPGSSNNKGLCSDVFYQRRKVFAIDEGNDELMGVFLKPVHPDLYSQKVSKQRDVREHNFGTMDSLIKLKSHKRSNLNDIGQAIKKMVDHFEIYGVAHKQSKHIDSMMMRFVDPEILKKEEFVANIFRLEELIKGNEALFEFMAASSHLHEPVIEVPVDFPVSAGGKMNGKHQKYPLEFQQIVEIFPSRKTWNTLLESFGVVKRVLRQFDLTVQKSFFMYRDDLAHNHGENERLRLHTPLRTLECLVIAFDVRWGGGRNKMYIPIDLFA